MKKRINNQPLTNSQEQDTADASVMPSKVHFENFHAIYTNEPLDYRREQFRSVIRYYNLRFIGIVVMIAIFAIFAPTWAFLGASGLSGIFAALYKVKGRSP